MKQRGVSLLLLLAAVLAAGSFGLAALQRETARRESDSSLQHETVEERTALESYFERARTVTLVTAENPGFRDWYQHAGAGPRRTDTKEVVRALSFLERLYPTSIGEACFIDRGGAENARVVRHRVAAAADLSPDESANPFFAPTFAAGRSHVYQARPYVSPDTREWVISNSTVVPVPGRAPAIVHFEVTLESFRATMARDHAAPYRVDVVDRRTGAIVLDSDTPQRRGARLARAGDRRFASLRGFTGRRTLRTLQGRRTAVVEVRRTRSNANDWLVVVSARSPVPSLASSFTVGPVLMLMGALLVLGLALLASRTRSLRTAAETDELTGLANRRGFTRRLEQAIAVAGRSGRNVALLVIDIDHFKEINDAMGHHVGDLLLEQIGPRLRTAIRDSDVLARLGGDEFAVILNDFDDAELPARVVERIEAAFAERFALGELMLDVKASLGIALVPEHATDAGDLLQRADVAMYQAKRAGTGHEVYDARRDTHSRERLQLAGELRSALEQGEFVPAFQPKTDLRTGRVVGVEALARWQHPERGELGPGVFLPLVEQSGLLGRLTLVILEAALAQVARWLADGAVLTVSVNITAADLADARFPEHVAGALARQGVAAEALVLEVTEDTVMSSPERMLEVLDRLSAQGVRLSLDDYGTGLSSLAYLKRLPISELKLDRSFVRELTAESADATIVQSTIRLAHSFGLEVVAEGVETTEAWSLLAGYACDVAQGFLVSRPVAAGELSALIELGFVPQPAAAG